MFIILIIFNILLSKIYGYNLQNINFLKKYEIKNELSNLLYKNDLKTVILNGGKTPLKKEYCRLFCQINNFRFKKFSYDKFIHELPFNKYEKTLLYIDDFLVGNGRILNHYEENILKSLPKTSNLIIFESDNIDTIPLKDLNLIRYFKILEFPKITKKDIVNYINDMILFNEYNCEMYMLNWSEYIDIEKLSLEKINILLFEINDMIRENMKFRIIHNKINTMINELLFI
jgi:hypothetical protein